MDQRVSLRRIHAAMDHLPMGTWPDTNHSASWSITDHLLANLIDEVRALHWLVASWASGKKLAKPDPQPRPGGKGTSAPRRKGVPLKDAAKALEKAGLARRHN